MMALWHLGRSQQHSRTEFIARGQGGAPWILALLIPALLLPGCRCPSNADDSPEPTAQTEAATESPAQQTASAVPEETPQEPPGVEDLQPGEQVSLFDGQTLGRWKVTDFGGQGDVHVENGAIYLPMGSYATGITWTGPVLRVNYEITLEAMRVDGTDFFCALTFPVGENPCTLVLGGWGGTLCGLSNIDYYDAAENLTTTFYAFEQKTWYHVRLRVLPDRITAWLDGESLVDIDTKGRKIDIRAEMDLCQPLGIATWVTTGAVRNIYLTRLAEPL